MIAETIPALRSRSPDQKIILAAELRHEAVGENDADLNPSLLEALRERLDFHRENPDGVSTWETIRGRIALNRATKI